MTDKPVVIITGVSSGIGLAATKVFTGRGWIVVGTVRHKKYPAELSTYAVDVQIAEMTKPGDIERVVRRAHQTYGRIDAVVANAGYGLLGALETLAHDQIVDQLAVNTVAVADLARLVVPIMRQQGHGTIAVVSSIGGRVGLPGYSVYSASKFALEGLMESLAYEVEDSGLRIKLIEPSTVKTTFWQQIKLGRGSSQGYTTQVVDKTVRQGMQGGLGSDRVAGVLYRAVTSHNRRLHYPVGLTGPAMILRRLLPDRAFRQLLRRYL